MRVEEDDLDDMFRFIADVNFNLHLPGLVIPQLKPLITATGGGKRALRRVEDDGQELRMSMEVVVLTDQRAVVQGTLVVHAHETIRVSRHEAPHVRVVLQTHNGMSLNCLVPRTTLHELRILRIVHIDPACHSANNDLATAIV